MKLLGLCAIALGVIACTPETTSIRPERRDITQAVYASGKIYPLDFTQVSTKVPGIVQEIFVNEGDTVVIGQPLLRIKSVANDVGIQAAQNQLSLARENAQTSGAFLMAFTRDVEAARARYVLDSLNAARQSRLLQQQATTRSAVDAAQTQLTISSESLNKAQDALRAARQRVATELRNAELQVSSQTAQRDDYIIYAAVSGRVYNVVPDVGELVTQQAVLVEIGSPSAYEVELSVDELDIALVHRGQRVHYAVDAYAGETFSGVITEITPRVSTSDKSSRVRATLVLTSQQVYPGMSVEANIITRQQKSALVIPREYLVGSNQVRVRRNGEDVTLRIEKGIQDLQYVEVRSGLTEQDEVVK